MKNVTHLFARRFMTTLLALFTAMAASASITQTNNNDVPFVKDINGNYLIQNVDDWNALAEYVKAGNNCSGMTFKMTDNIATVTKTVGYQTSANANDRKRFSGTFDGQGHTLTVNLNANESEYNKNYCAPFAYVHNATFMNLTVMGTVNACNSKYATGLVGSMTGGGTIENCHVGIVLTSSLKGDGTDASFVGIVESDITLNMTNCWFDGQLLGENTYNCGGMVAYNKGTVNFTNCLFNPEKLTFNTAHTSDISSTFARKENNGRINNFENAYYTQALGTEETGTVLVCSEENKQDIYTYEEVTAADGQKYYYIVDSDPWNILNAALNTNNGQTVTLEQNIIAGTESSALVINEGVTVTLDMKGHTLNRNLSLETEARENGYVIKVCEGATLNIIDSGKGGTITGGKNSDNGGAIYNEGTLTLKGVTITGNKAKLGGGIYMGKGHASIDSNVTIKNNKGNSSNNDLYLNSAATVTISNGAKLEAETISVKSGSSLIMEDGGQLISKSEVRITAKKEIKAYDPDSNPSDGWHFIATPTKNAYEINDAITCNDYDLYKLNGKTWENQKAHADFTSLDNGTGYLYANSSNMTLAFNGTIKSYNANNNTLRLVEGWNLIGNPYTFNVYSNKPYYVITEENSGTITPATSAKDAIKPCTGFLVHCNDPEGGTVALSKEPISWKENSANNGNIQMALTQNFYTRSGHSTQIVDKAIVSFDADEELGKFYFGDGNAHLYIPKDGEEFAIVSVAGRDGACTVSTEMPVNFKAERNGTYTLTVQPESVEMGYLHLIDHITGTDIDLLANPNYTFEANVSDYESRFKLVFSANNGISETDSDNFAFFANGQIIVTAGTSNASLQVVDMLGRVIVTRRDGACAVSTDGIAPGVYVLRLINGNETRTQKIVIK